MPLLTLAPSLTLHYLSENDTASPPVLLLHGLGASGASWQPTLSFLAGAGYRVLAPDLRGFGQSSYPGSTDIPLMAADMAALLQKTGAAPAHVVGISLGGTVALQLALDQPALLRRLVLINTFARLRPSGLSDWWFFLRRLVTVYTLGLEAQARLVARRMFPRPDQEQQRRRLVEQVAQANPHGYRATMRALWQFNVEDRLKELRVPTLILSGADDSTVSVANQATLATRIPAAQHIVIPGAGHALAIDQPEAFHRAVVDFLAG